MGYAQAQPRLAALGCDLGEGFWTAVRGNLARFGEVEALAAMVRGPVTPVVEDAGFLAKAAALLPDPPAWGPWTDAIKAETGRRAGRCSSR
jgi:glutamyl-tRNA synthetase